MNELPNENVINVISLLIFEKYLKVFHFLLSLYFLRDVTNVLSFLFSSVFRILLQERIFTLSFRRSSNLYFLLRK